LDAVWKPSWATSGPYRNSLADQPQRPSTHRRARGRRTGPVVKAGGALGRSPVPIGLAARRLGQFGGHPHHPPIPAPIVPEAADASALKPPIAARARERPSDRQQPGPAPTGFAPDEMRSLAESISAHGLLQPVVVRRVHERYQLVAGERRLRAAIQAGWIDVPVNIIEADDRQMAELAIVENLQRKDLNALEKAASFQKYLDQYGCTQEELAAGSSSTGRPSPPDSAVGIARNGAGGRPSRQDYPGSRPGAAALGDEQEQTQFSQRIQREGLSVRQTEVLVQETIDAADREPLAVSKTPEKPSRSPRAKNEHIAALEQESARRWA